jgi:ectoine hydroxylase-related dioxygenase (phytanoyl-CoA dioxygenase family)
MKQSAEKYLTGEPKLVRVILFDKTAANNWLVTWHQDKTVAVSQRHDISGWGPWSIKDGVHHVQPTIDVLNQMVTFRIHLDDSMEEKGCLRLIPKSHTNGIMSHEEIQHYVRRHEQKLC